MTIPIAVDDVAVAPPEAAIFVACPSCHTTDTLMTTDALAAGAGWRCGRCGQQWTAGRLATVAAYDRWAAGRRGGERGVQP